jgi:hypothetical protein
MGDPEPGRAAARVGLVAAHQEPGGAEAGVVLQPVIERAVAGHGRVGGDLLQRLAGLGASQDDAGHALAVLAGLGAAGAVVHRRRPQVRRDPPGRIVGRAPGHGDLDSTIGDQIEQKVNNEVQAKRWAISRPRSANRASIRAAVGAPPWM